MSSAETGRLNSARLSVLFRPPVEAQALSLPGWQGGEEFQGTSPLSYLASTVPKPAEESSKALTGLVLESGTSPRHWVTVHVIVDRAVASREGHTVDSLGVHGAFEPETISKRAIGGGGAYLHQRLLMLFLKTVIERLRQRHRAV